MKYAVAELANPGFDLPPAGTSLTWVRWSPRFGKAPLEREEQARFAEVLDALRLVWWHTPNGEARPAAKNAKTGKRYSLTGAALQELGVKPGIPDVLIASRPPAAPERPGVAVEMKRRTDGELSPDQRERLLELREEGWLVFVACGSDDARDALAVAGWDNRDNAGKPRHWPAGGGGCPSVVHARDKDGQPKTGLSTPRAFGPPELEAALPALRVIATHPSRRP